MPILRGLHKLQLNGFKSLFLHVFKTSKSLIFKGSEVFCYIKRLDFVYSCLHIYFLANLSHDRQTTVRADSLVTYTNSKYSVSPEYIGKPVRISEKTRASNYTNYFSQNLACIQSNIILIEILPPLPLRFLKLLQYQMLLYTLIPVYFITSFFKAEYSIFVPHNFLTLLNPIVWLSPHSSLIFVVGIT